RHTGRGMRLRSGGRTCRPGAGKLTVSDFGLRTMKNLRSTRSLIASLAAAPIMMAAAWPAMAEAAMVPRRPAAGWNRGASFGHLVGGTEQTCGQLDPERLCGLEIDHELEFRRRLHRQTGNFFTFKDTIDVSGRAPELFDSIRPIRN